MGTNVVRLTDRKYMMELRRRIHDDFNDMLSKRIERREVSELFFCFFVNVIRYIWRYNLLCMFLFFFKNYYK